MKLGCGTHTYEVVEGWAKLPEGVATGYTHGVAVDSMDRVYVHNQSKDAISTFTLEGFQDRMCSDAVIYRFTGRETMRLF